MSSSTPDQLPGKTPEAIFDRLLLQATLYNARARGINVPPLSTRRSSGRDPVYLVSCQHPDTQRTTLVWAGPAANPDDARTRTIEEVFIKPADDPTYQPDTGLDVDTLQQALPL